MAIAGKTLFLDVYVPTPPVQVCQERAAALVKQFVAEDRPGADMAAFIYNAAYLEAHYEVWGAIEQILDDLMKEYTKDGRWDDALSVWAYGKGFDAGLYHASLAAAQEKSAYSPRSPRLIAVLKNLKRWRSMSELQDRCNTLMRLDYNTMYQLLNRARSKGLIERRKRIGWTGDFREPQYEYRVVKEKKDV